MNNETQKPSGQEEVLRIEDLVVHYETVDGVAEALNGISLTLHSGEALGLVGETGAGKTTIGLSIMGLLPTPPAHIIEGKVFFKGRDMDEMSKGELRSIRGKDISMIFQDPMTALNPVHTIGEQIAEVVMLHSEVSKAEALERAKEMLRIVGLPEERHNEYPHQFSGGMKQRVVIAIALACNPELLLADEPTTALDVTIQAQVMEMIADLQKKLNTAMILITHDLGIVAESCDDVAVIYAGEIVELATKRDLFLNPQHPYTIGLFGSIPSLSEDVDRLTPIPGLPANPEKLPEGCHFNPRCSHCTEACKHGEIPWVEVTPGHFVRCTLCAGKKAE